MEKKTQPAAGQEALGYASPTTYEELRAVLSSGTAQMPKKLRQIAIFMWQHPDEVALGSSASLAQQAGVQPSTLVRFAQTLGFSGFSEFQELFKAHVKATWPAGGAKRSPSRRVAEPMPKMLGGLVSAAQESLARLESTFNEDSFNTVVEKLASAKNIYLLGSKRAYPVAHYMSLTFFQQGVFNVLIDNIGSVAMDQVTCISKGDVVLAISFSPYNSITPEVAAAARDYGADVVAITDSKFSPLVDLSSSYLEIVESTHAGFRSLSSTIVLGMSLVLAVVQARAIAKTETE